MIRYLLVSRKVIRHHNIVALTIRHCLSLRRVIRYHIVVMWRQDVVILVARDGGDIVVVSYDMWLDITYN